MQLPDVNVLVYAHREDTAEHEKAARFVTALATRHEPFALSETALHGVVRVVTNRKIFPRPSTLDEVFTFIAGLRSRPNCRMLRPGPRHFDIFVDLCRRSRAWGKLVADAYHAALAIEQGCEWVTADSDFSRFPGLRWRHLDDVA